MERRIFMEFFVSNAKKIALNTENPRAEHRISVYSIEKNNSHPI